MSAKRKVPLSAYIKTVDDPCERHAALTEGYSVFCYAEHVVVRVKRWKSRPS